MIGEKDFENCRVFVKKFFFVNTGLSENQLILADGGPYKMQHPIQSGHKHKGIVLANMQRFFIILLSYNFRCLKKRYTVGNCAQAHWEKSLMWCFIKHICKFSWQHCTLWSMKRQEMFSKQNCDEIYNQSKGTSSLIWLDPTHYQIKTQMEISAACCICIILSSIRELIGGVTEELSGQEACQETHDLRFLNFHALFFFLLLSNFDAPADWSVPKGHRDL